MRPRMNQEQAKILSDFSAQAEELREMWKKVDAKNSQSVAAYDLKVAEYNAAIMKAGSLPGYQIVTYAKSI